MSRFAEFCTLLLALNNVGSPLHLAHDLGCVCLALSIVRRTRSFAGHDYL